MSIDNSVAITNSLLTNSQTRDIGVPTEQVKQTVKQRKEVQVPF